MVSTATWSSPPRTWPTIAIAKRTSRKLIPPFSIVSPARMKNGSVSRMKWPVLSTMFCAVAIIGATSVSWRKKTTPSSIAKLTCNPIRIVAKNRISMIVSVIPVPARGIGRTPTANRMAARPPTTGTTHATTFTGYSKASRSSANSAIRTMPTQKGTATQAPLICSVGISEPDVIEM